MSETKNRRTGLSYEDEMAWKERKKEIDDEGEYGFDDRETKEIFALTHNYEFLDDEYGDDEIKRNMNNTKIKEYKRKCKMLLDAMEKIKSVDYTKFWIEFSMLDSFYEDRYSDDKNEDSKILLKKWKSFKASIIRYISNRKGYDKINEYLPKGFFKLSKPKKDSFDLGKEKIEQKTSKDKGVIDKAVQNKLSQKD